MAHNINFNEQTGKHAFFSTKQPAWHGLGTIVQDYPTSAQAIGFAGLDYTVAKAPLFAKGADPLVSFAVPDQYATMRTDNNAVFGVVGKDYQIVQNADAFAFFDAIVGGGEGIMYETAGALGNGERIFITAKLPGYIRVGNGDDVTEKYIFLTTSHDGSGSITAAFTPVRIVCQNTLNAALRSASNVVRIRHTAGAKERLEQAHKVMGVADKLSVQLEGIFNNWAEVKIQDNDVKKLIQFALCPNKETFDLLKKGAADELSAVYKNACEAAFEYAMADDTQLMPTTKGTLFGAYNAVTGYYQNVRSFKTGEDKVKSILLGGTAQIRGQKAFDLCRDFEKGGAAALLMN
jgi:phage/plasmid-like protein (TIGR03299 family)